MSFDYKINKEYIISESPNKMIKLSWIVWNNSGNEKIDIRHWYDKPTIDGSNITMGKGISLNEEDVKELVNILLENGYGNHLLMKNILENKYNIKINIPDDETDIEEHNYIDPKTILDM